MKSTKKRGPAIAEVLNAQMESFLKRLEGQNYAPDGVSGYGRRLRDFCARVAARGIPRDCNGNCVSGWSNNNQSASTKSGLSRSPKSHHQLIDDYIPSLTFGPAVRKIPDI